MMRQILQNTTRREFCDYSNIKICISKYHCSVMNACIRIIVSIKFNLFPHDLLENLSKRSLKSEGRTIMDKHSQLFILNPTDTLVFNGQHVLPFYL